MSIQKKLPLLFAIFLGATTMLSAENKDQDSLISEMSHNSMSHNIKPNGASGPTLASSLPVIDEYAIHVEAGLILEQFRISNTDVSYMHGGTLMSNPDPLTSPYTDPYSYDNTMRYDFDLDAGVRVGLGFDTRYDDWRFLAVFEWLKGKGTLVGAPLPGGNAGYYVPSAMTDIYYTDETSSTNFGQMNAGLYVDYYLLDFSLSRGSFTSNRVSFEPFAGVKSTWIYYDSSENYFDEVAENGQLPAGEAWRRVQYCDVWAVGPMAGMNMNYYLVSGFSIFSSGNFSVLFGQTHLTMAYGFEEEATDVRPSFEKVTDVDNILTCTLRAILGLQYDAEMFPKGHRVRIRGGFDTRYYLAQYAQVRMDANSSLGLVTVEELPIIHEAGNFGMVGLILDVAIDF